MLYPIVINRHEPIGASSEFNTKLPMSLSDALRSWILNCYTMSYPTVNNPHEPTGASSEFNIKLPMTQSS